MNHFSCDVLLTSHTPFSTGKYYQIIYQNASLIILWRCLADRAALSNIQRKMFPQCNSFLQDCFTHAFEISGPRCHLAIDTCLDKKTNHSYPVRTNVLPHKNQWGEFVHCPVFFKYKNIKK